MSVRGTSDLLTLPMGKEQVVVRRMTIEKLEIPLHDRSLVQVLRTDSGAIYLEVYGPGNLRDGQGYILKNSTLLSDETISGLRQLLITGVQRPEAA